LCRSSTNGGRFFRSGVRGPYAPFCERKAARLIT
jgi:hypothetical protein